MRSLPSGDARAHLERGVHIALGERFAEMAQGFEAVVTIGFGERVGENGEWLATIARGLFRR